MFTVSNIIYIAGTTAEHEGHVVVTIKLSLKKISTKLFLLLILASTKQTIYLTVLEPLKHEWLMELILSFYYFVAI